MSVWTIALVLLAQALVIAGCSMSSDRWMSQDARRRGLGREADEELLLSYIPDGLRDDCWAAFEREFAPPGSGWVPLREHPGAVAGFVCFATEDDGGLGTDRGVVYLLYPTRQAMDHAYRSIVYGGADDAACASEPPSACEYLIDGVPTGTVARAPVRDDEDDKVVWTIDDALVLGTAGVGIADNDVGADYCYSWWVRSQLGAVTLGPTPDRLAASPGSVA
jgi:hypothetical protein